MIASKNFSNIALVGFMGVGKTATAKLLAKRLDNFTLVHTDDLVREKFGWLTIPEIFAVHGQEAFFEAEESVISGLEGRSSLVISSGATVVLNRLNVESLRRHCLIVVLTANPQTILERTKDNPNRPLLNVPDPQAEVLRLQEKWDDACYGLGPEFSTDLQSPSEITRHIARLWKEAKKVRISFDKR